MGLLGGARCNSASMGAWQGRPQSYSRWPYRCSMDGLRAPRIFRFRTWRPMQPLWRARPSSLGLRLGRWYNPHLDRQRTTPACITPARISERSWRKSTSEFRILWFELPFISATQHSYINAIPSLACPPHRTGRSSVTYMPKSTVHVRRQLRRFLH